MSSETIYTKTTGKKPVSDNHQEFLVSRTTHDTSVKYDSFPPATLPEPTATNSPQRPRRTNSDFRKASNQSPRNMQNSSVISKPEASSIGASGRQSSLRKSQHQQYKIFPNRRAKYARNHQLQTSKFKVPHGSRAASSSEGLQKYSHSAQSSSHPREPKSGNKLSNLEHQLEPETTKTKLKSLWHTFIYGWTLQSKSSFKYDSPLFILGKCYHKRKEDESTDADAEFLGDFVSRIWLTYRRNFYPIPGSTFSTDCGWGCMLRTGQMLIAQSLVTHFLGRDWRLCDKQTDTDSVFHREIIRWFSEPLDTPSDKTPFCLHHLVNYGRLYHKCPGDWFGPASVASIFSDAFLKASQSVPVLSQICLYVAQDCTVILEDVLKLCTRIHPAGSQDVSSDCETESSELKQKNKKWLRSLILLIPMRLGADVTNEVYFPCLKSLLSHDSCMGIIGGRPKHSLYFLGWQDNKLLYLDPHLCRDAVDTTASDFKTETFHCKTPRKLHMDKMDPSCTVGFYIKNAEDFQNFVQDVKEFISPPKQRNVYPLFTFSDGRQGEPNADQWTASSDKRLRVKHYHVNEYGQKTFAGESEEFIVL
ncbi:hypothetical protein BsWGS_02741 [Bradybaena similaris]